MKFMKSEVNKTLEYIQNNSGQQMAVVDIARYVEIPHSKARYLLELLIKQGRIKKIAVKGTHKYYVRYTYEFIK